MRSDKTCGLEATKKLRSRYILLPYVAGTNGPSIGEELESIEMPFSQIESEILRFQSIVIRFYM